MLLQPTICIHLYVQNVGAVKQVRCSCLLLLLLLLLLLPIPVPQVHIYNTPQLRRCTPAGRPADITAAQRVFPKGQRIGIIEPFYKVMMDGTLGVRVDNPAEVGNECC
jgi:hypothetical protein